MENRTSYRLEYADLSLAREEVQATWRKAFRASAWAVVMALALAAGALLQLAADPAGRSATGRYLMVGLFIAAAIATSIGLIAALARLAQTRVMVTVVACILVLCCFFLAVVLFNMTPLRKTIGHIHANESPERLAINSALMRFWLFSAPVLMVGVATALLSRRWRQTMWPAGAMAAATLSAALWGLHYWGQSPWIYWMKWPKLASTALLPLIYGMLVIAVVRAWDGLRHREKPRLWPHCANDLRAHSPGQLCPECGTIIPEQAHLDLPISREG